MSKNVTGEHTYKTFHHEANKTFHHEVSHVAQLSFEEAHMINDVQEITSIFRANIPSSRSEGRKLASMLQRKMAETTEDRISLFLRSTCIILSTVAM